MGIEDVTAMLSAENHNGRGILQNGFVFRVSIVRHQLCLHLET